ncbi:MAG: helix-turn-helix domain-containing protein [Bdellovibrionales bacterium]|nr:helix-turn-helix domain-containing protein [Bdellovibrionales bacterium]
MKKITRPGYRRGGLDFANLEFSGAAEIEYVKAHVERIARKVHAARKEQKISQERLAELVSASTSTIRAIEQGQRAPSLPMLLKILFVLDRKAKIW